MSGQRAFITGAGAGLGRAIAISLAESGADVFVTDLDGASAEHTAAELRTRFPAIKATAAQLDVRNGNQVRDVHASAADQLHGLTIGVNNAGVSSMAPVTELTEAAWDENMNVNAKGVFLCCQAQVRVMLQRKTGGAIVNLASMAGKQGARLLAHYAASKFAVIGFTQSLALEVAQYGIRVNSVCPGYVRTAMQEREAGWQAEIEGITREEVLQTWAQNVPLGRLEEPEDVAGVVTFLLSDSARYMTGQAVNVTGGAWMC